MFVELTNGANVAFPAELVAGLAGASTAELDVVSVTGDGYVLHWPGLGAYLSFLAMLTDVLGAGAHLMRLAGAKPKSAEERASAPPPQTAAPLGAAVLHAAAGPADLGLGAKL